VEKGEGKSCLKARAHCSEIKQRSEDDRRNEGEKKGDPRTVPGGGGKHTPGRKTEDLSPHRKVNKSLVSPRSTKRWLKKNILTGKNSW